MCEQGINQASNIEADMAIEENRYYRGIYEYLIKNLLALIKYDLAILLLKRAVR